MNQEEQAFFFVKGERNLIRDKQGLEDTVREEMLNIFDNVIKSHASNSGIIDLARTVAFTVEKTTSLEATRAVCQPLFCDDKDRVRKYTDLVLNIFHKDQFRNPGSTTKLGETFERYHSLDTIHEGWYGIMKQTYIDDSGVEERVMTQIDLNSRLPIDEQEKVINFMSSFIDKYNNKESLNEREALDSVFRTIEVFNQSSFYFDVIDTLEAMISWHYSFNMMKGTADLLFSNKESSYLGKIAEVIREGNDQAYLKVLNNCPDIHNLNKENLVCYMRDLLSRFKDKKLSYNLPLRTVNNLVTAYNIVVGHFDNDDGLLKFDAGDVFYQVLNEKVKLGGTDQEKIRILDQWSTNVYRKIRDNPEQINFMELAA